MNLQDILSVLGGFGMFLFSLRYLTRLLQRSLSRRLRDAFATMLSSPGRCLILGALATALVHASSISIMATMALLGSTLINFEQAFFLMLGATVGTTVKAWFLYDILGYGPALLGISSLALVVVRRPHTREFLEALLSLGVAFTGLKMMSTGLHPLTLTPFFRGLLEVYPGAELYQQLVGVLLGTLVAAALESSSAAVALTLSLAAAGDVTYPQGAALILGANIGTTFTLMFASIEHGAEMRRLALSHFLVKLFGVGITLFFFPYFVQAVALLIPDSVTAQADRLVVYRLAAVHTIFNLINAAWWSVFGAFVIRMAYWLVPSRDQRSPSLALVPVVRKLLSRSPDSSLAEAERQLAHLKMCVKALLDRSCALMQEGQSVTAVRVENLVMEQREFEGLKESVQDLLIQVVRLRPGEGSVNELSVRRLLTELGDFEDLYYQAWRLRERLEHGVAQEGYELPERLRPACVDFQRTVDELWLKVLFGREVPDPTRDPRLVLKELADSYFGSLLHDELTGEQQAWVYDILSCIRALLQHLVQISEDRIGPSAIPGEPTPTGAPASRDAGSGADNGQVASGAPVEHREQ